MITHDTRHMIMMMYLLGAVLTEHLTARICLTDKVPGLLQHKNVGSQIQNKPTLSAANKHDQ